MLVSYRGDVCSEGNGCVVPGVCPPHTQPHSRFCRFKGKCNIQKHKPPDHHHRTATAVHHNSPQPTTTLITRWIDYASLPTRAAAQYKEADQTEKAYQKQDAIFIGKKRVIGKPKRGKGFRFWKSVGLGFKTPKLAIEGTYVDKKCPFTGNVSIRGRILKAMVINTKMNRTVVVRRDYLRYVSKYRRYVVIRALPSPPPCLRPSLTHS